MTKSRDLIDPIKPFDDNTQMNRWIIYEDDLPEQKSKKPKIVLFVFGFLILCGIGIICIENTPNSINTIYEKYHTVYKVDSDQNNHLLQAVMSYRKGDYNMAVKLFHEASQQKYFQIPHKFYLAVSYSQCYKFSEAINLYEEILASGNDDYYVDTSWYLGLCYLKKYEIGSAKKQFKYLAGIDGKYSQRATEILNLLEDI